MPSVIAPPQTQGAFDLWTLVRAIGRRWILAVFLGLLFGGAAAAAAWKLIPRPFTASALVRISVREPRVLYHQEEISFETYRATHAVMIRSPIVLNNALNRPEVVSLPRTQREPDMLDWLQRHIAVGFPGGEVMRISMSGEEASELATFVNAVLDSYLAEAMDSEQSSRLQKIAELEKLETTSQQTVQQKRNILKEVAERLGTLETTTAAVKHQAQLQRYMHLNNEMSRLQYDRMRADVRARTAKLRSESGAFEIADKTIDDLTNADPQIRGFRGQIADLEKKIADYDQVAVKKDSPTLLRYRNDLELARTALENRRQELRPEVEAQLRETATRGVNLEMKFYDDQVLAMDEQIKDIVAELERLKTELDQLGHDSVELEFLRKEVEQNEQVYNRAFGELMTMRVELQAPSRVAPLSRATPPRARDTNMRDKGTMLAGGSAFALAFLLVGLIECRARRITSPIDVTREIGIKVVGTVPALLGRQRVLPSSGRQLSTRARRWYRVFEESFDVLRTTLNYTSDGPPIRSMMVTSAHGREGKTTLSSHIAASLARSGRMTLLVDGDLRRPAIASLFGIPNKIGLVDVVEGRVKLADAIHATGIPNLHLLTSGKPRGSISQLIADPRFGAFLRNLPQEWDNVVLDAPPILPVSDGLVFGQFVDGVVLTALCGVTGAVALKDAQNRLATVGVRTLGLVLMGFEPSSYYGYYVSGYYNRYAQANSNGEFERERNGEANGDANGEANGEMDH